MALRCFRLLFFAALLSIMSVSSGAQKVKVIYGSIAALAKVTSYVVNFSYDSMTVSRKRVREEVYVNERIDELNEHRHNQGDNWAAGWRRKRQELYEPAFMNALAQEGIGVENFDDHTTSQYMIIFKTTHTETGYNIGIKRRSARIDGMAWIVETNNPERVIAKISLKKCLGKTDDGYDFNAGQRLVGSYEVAGRRITQLLKEGK